MSSEEVAELAQAIHNHADVLYESWRKGQEAMNMKRMEDTLELLADPGLTPKLEHLVSTFVRRDKAKRQQFQQAPDNQIQRESSPIGGAARKPKENLPKSILAVVRRFEPPSSADSNNGLEIHPPTVHSPRERSRSPAVENLNRMNIPGVGPVNKNVLWADSINRYSSSERIGDSRKSPSPSPTPTSAPPNIKNYLDSAASNNQALLNQSAGVGDGTTQTLIITSLMGKPVKERHIPIERLDDRESSKSPKTLTQHNNKTLQSQRLKAGGRSSISPETNGLTSKLSHPVIQHEIKTETYDPKSNGLGSLSMLENKAMSPDPSPPLNSNDNLHHQSRVAFAKERIRQSQENPLTQQRLALQKRLPFPNGNLAAAIALQQGKLKFQAMPNGHSPHHISADEVDVRNAQQGHQARESGRNSFIRFGPGATVADRVQLFEKYPPHISPLSSLHGHGSKSPSPSRTQGHVITHPIHIQDAPSPRSRDLYPDLEQIDSLAINNYLNSGGINNKSSLQSASQFSSAPSNNTQPLVINSGAPWRTSPSRDGQLALQLQHVQPLESPIVPSTVKTPTVLTSPIPSPKKHPSERNRYVPRFFFPVGKPPSPASIQQTLSKAEVKLKQWNNCVDYSKFGELLTASGIPLYWKKPFWSALHLLQEDLCTSEIFLPYLQFLLKECPDDAARFVRIVSTAAKNFPAGSEGKTLNNNNVSVKSRSKYPGQNCQDIKYVELAMDDFIPMVQDIIDTHPGLGFLRGSPEFHSRYNTTVISRIFYKVNRSWSGRLTLTEIRRSNLLRMIQRLEDETDINNITEYFSYEHFYVIYCKFWELDKDHDLLIDKEDLAFHADHALSVRIIGRIFSGAVLRGWDGGTPSPQPSRGKMTYSDFVWFLLSEEDKRTQTAIEYWFRCLDMDGDGIISPYELQYFYSEQENRIESMGVEPLHFSNIYCQIVDMLQCSPTGIRLRDLKKSPNLAATVFNTAFNLDKYLDHEQRDPFATASSIAGSETGEGESDWDKFAAAEYELLIAEESPAEHLNDSGIDDLTASPK